MTTTSGENLRACAAKHHPRIVGALRGLKDARRSSRVSAALRRTSKCIVLVVVQLAIGSGRICVNCHIPGRDNSRSLALVTVWF